MGSAEGERRLVPWRFGLRAGGSCGGERTRAARCLAMNRRHRRAEASRGKGEKLNFLSPEQVYRHVADGGRAIGHEALSKGRTTRRLYEMVDRAAAFAERFRERHRGEVAGLACKRGCDHCCHLPVASSAPSILRIADALRQQLAPADLDAVLSRIGTLDAATRGREWSPSLRGPTPCAFLVNHACTIYGMRPFVCRAWNSADADDCRRALDQQTVEMRFDVFQRATFAGIERGLKDALIAHQLDPVDLDFCPALKVALLAPDAGDRWLRGEPIFAGCEARRPDDRRALPLA